MKPILLTKKQAEEERKRSKNLCWPYLPAIYKLLPKKKSKTAKTGGIEMEEI